MAGNKIGGGTDQLAAIYAKQQDAYQKQLDKADGKKILFFTVGEDPKAAERIRKAQEMFTEVIKSARDDDKNFSLSLR